MTTNAAKIDRSKVPTEIHFSAGERSLVVAEAQKGAAGATAAPPKLTMIAYSGGRMDLGWFGAMYVDLAGMELPKESRMPILRQHDGNRIAGQTTLISKGDGDKGPLTLEAELYDTEAGLEIAKLSKAGFRWQASIGWKVDPDKYQFLDDEDQKASVNGVEVAGPAIICRRSVLKEASAVPLGADGATSATVTASIDSPRASAPPTPPKKRSLAMADPTPTPEKKGATLAELKAAFPKDREFALDQFEAGATLPEAKAAFADVLQARIDAIEAADKAAAEKKPAAPARAPRLPVQTGPVPATEATASAQYHEIMRAEIASGKTSMEARHAAAGFARDLDPHERQRRQAIHTAYLSEINGTPWTPMKARAAN